MDNQRAYCFSCMNPIESKTAVCPKCGYDNSVRENGPGCLPEALLCNGKYLVGKRLGHGGFGITYIGRDMVLERIVAIKEFYPKQLVMRDAQTQRLRPLSFPGYSENFDKSKDKAIREGRVGIALQNLNNIVKTYDVFLENDTVYLVMEYINGQTLKSYVKQHGGKLSFDVELLPLMIPIMDTLEAIHNQGYVHRDISPDNIMVRRERFEAVLLDFGAAREIEQSNESTSITFRDGYTAPEQYNNRWDERTDEYALCATMYYAVTGVMPMNSIQRTVFDSSTDKLQRPSELGGQITEEAEDVLLKGMSVNANDRYENIYELKCRLKETIPTMVDWGGEQRMSMSVPTSTRSRSSAPMPVPKSNSMQGDAPIKPAADVPHSTSNSRKVPMWTVATACGLLLFAGAAGTWLALNDRNATPVATQEPTLAVMDTLALAPTAAPTQAPTTAPTQAPTTAPTQAPTTAPTQAPTTAPTQAPTTAPTQAPTTAPTQAPTAAPTQVPTAVPTQVPTAEIVYEPVGKLSAVEIEGKYGYEDETGTLCIEPRWDYAGAFSEGIALVSAEGRYGYIAENGDVVIELQWDAAGAFSEGLAWVELDGKRGFIDKDGNLVIALEWDYAASFSEGLAWVELDGKRGFIDKDGNLVIALEWDYASSFVDGTAMVERDGAIGYIDPTGSLVGGELKYLSDRLAATTLNADELVVYSEGDKYGFEDAQGNVVIEPQWDSAEPFSEELALVSLNGKYGFINKVGACMIKLQWDSAGSFSQGLAWVELNGKYGYIDIDGNVAIELEWDGASSFVDDMAKVERDGRALYIDRAGNVVDHDASDEEASDAEPEAAAESAYIRSSHQNDGIYSYYESESGEIVTVPPNAVSLNDAEGQQPVLVALYTNGKYCYMYENGELLVGPVFDEAWPFDGEIARVKLNGKYACIDRSGEFITEIDTWDYIGNFKDGLALIQVHNKSGLIDADGNVVSDPVWDCIGAFVDDYAWVGSEGKYGFIDRSGALVIEPEWDSTGNFSEGLASVERDGKFGFVDRNGSIVVEPQWDSVGDFTEGMAWVELDGKFGFVDASGSVVCEPEWDAVYNCSEGLALVESGGKYGYIDQSGELVIKLIWDYAESFNDGTAYVEHNGVAGSIDSTGEILSGELQDMSEYLTLMATEYICFKDDTLYGFADESGNVLIEPEWENARNFHDGYAVVGMGFGSSRKYGYINKNGGMICELEWDFAYDFADCAGRVLLDDKYGYINDNGDIISEPQWDMASDFVNGMAMVMSDGKYGFINLQGEVVSEPQWDSAGTFSDGLAWVERDGKRGYIDMNGDLVIELEWDNAWPFSDGYAQVKQNGEIGFIDQYGIYMTTRPEQYNIVYDDAIRIPFKEDGLYGYKDEDGNVVIEAQWDNVGGFHEGRAWVKIDGKYGIIDTNGTVIAEPQWDLVEEFSEGLALVRVDYVDGGCEHGYVNRNGQLVIGLKWHDLYAFSEGLAVVCYDGLWGCINHEGEVVIEPQWQHMEPFSNGLALVGNGTTYGSSYGYVDRNGELVLDQIWSYAQSFTDGCALVMNSRGEGHIDTRGNILDGTIKYIMVGDRGDSVIELQQALIDRGYLKGSADGIFGNNTRLAVEQFQEDDGLEVNGIADEPTRSALNLD